MEEIEQIVVIEDIEYKLCPHYPRFYASKFGKYVVKHPNGKFSKPSIRLLA